MAERICDAKYTFFGELCKKSLRLLALVFLSLTAMMTFAQQSNYLNRTNPKGEKFTEAQIKSLRERLKQAGCRFGSYNGITIGGLKLSGKKRQALFLKGQRYQ